MEKRLATRLMAKEVEKTSVANRVSEGQGGLLCCPSVIALAGVNSRKKKSIGKVKLVGPLAWQMSLDPLDRTLYEQWFSHEKQQTSAPEEIGNALSLAERLRNRKTGTIQTQRPKNDAISVNPGVLAALE